MTCVLSGFLHSTNKELSELNHENFLENSRARGEIYPFPGEFSPRGIWGYTEQNSECGGQRLGNIPCWVGALQLVAVASLPMGATAQKVVEFAKKRGHPGWDGPRKPIVAPTYAIGMPPRSNGRPPSDFAPVSFFPFFSTVPFFAI